MRKFVLAGLALMFTVGLTLAANVVFVDYKDKTLTVKEDGAEKTYKVTDDTKFVRGTKDVPNDKGIAALERLAKSEKTKGKAKLEITTSGGKVTEIKFKAGKRKKKDQ